MTAAGNKQRTGWKHPDPRATEIALALLANPDLFGLRRRRLIADVRDRYGVGHRVARDAVDVAGDNLARRRHA